MVISGLSTFLFRSSFYYMHEISVTKILKNCFFFSPQVMKWALDSLTHKQHGGSNAFNVAVTWSITVHGIDFPAPPVTQTLVMMMTGILAARQSHDWHFYLWRQSGIVLGSWSRTEENVRCCLVVEKTGLESIWDTHYRSGTFWVELEGKESPVWSSAEEMPLEPEKCMRW